jgi:DNA invertase Pin-like site-specific DNA recombinase
VEDAISYKRFSTPKQARGDSQRRQTDLAAEYCKRHGLRLIETYLDAGLSGFTGANLSDRSALTALLHAAKTGKLKPGTRLIVESLDRLSRQEMSLAVRLFLDILDTGLVIVTLIDGEQEFTKERVDSDLTALIIAIVYLSRANNESRTRRERAAQMQQAARRRARERKIPMTAECPSWLTLTKRRGVRRFVVNHDKARVVEQIFRMVVAGMGTPQIATFLNNHQVPPLSGKPRWRSGMIAYLIANQAVVGRFHPCLSVIEGGKRRRIPDPEGPIDGYFPAVISEELYSAARRAARSRRKNRGQRRVPAYCNLVAHLGRCALCGGPLHHVKCGGGWWSYLRCANARYKECTNRFGFPYRKLEAVLLALDDLSALVSKASISFFSTGCGTAEIERDGPQPGDGRYRDELFARFAADKAKAESEEVIERDLARRSLVDTLRQIVDGVVLQVNRTLTIHTKPDFTGCRATYLLTAAGLQGVQLRMPEGATGFIDRSAVTGLVWPVRSGCKTPAQADDEPWQPQSLDEVWSRLHVLPTPDGDWQATAADPMQMAEVAARAERALAPG